MRTLKSIGFLCVFHVLSHWSSEQWFLRQAERWILRCCSWCSFLEGKVATGSSFILEDFSTYHLNLSTVFNSAGRSTKKVLFTCGFRGCGLITRSESITERVNLVNSWFFHICPRVFLFIWKGKVHGVEQYLVCCIFRARFFPNYISFNVSLNRVSSTGETCRLHRRLLV